MATARSLNSPTDGYSRFTNDFANVAGSFSATATHRGSINAEHGLDYPNELGSTNSLDRSGDGGSDSVEMCGALENPLGAERHWEMNYHEAAIFLEEGEHNEKFDSHPRHPSDLPAYLIVHNPWYHGLDLVTSLLLLLLAFVEEPAIPFFRVPVWLHGSMELLCLGVIALQLGLKLRWIGWRMLLSHNRTLLKCICLCLMIIEACAVLIRQSSHLRLTRSLRPIFLLDTRQCGAVRRFIRQILQSLPPILDMLGLLLFFVAVYSLLGYFLFSGYPHDKYFANLQDSFVSLFVLLTTANFPDVMMPSYARSKWNAIFFISYLCIVLYLLMNLMLAVVYETFTRIEREKFKKLLLHRRKACQHGFRLLVSKTHPDQIRFRQFRGLLKYYCPQKCERDVVLMFKHLNTSNSGYLTLREFYNVYDARELSWSAQLTNVPWYHDKHEWVQGACRRCGVIANSPYLEHFIFIVLVCNCVAMVLRAMQFDSEDLETSAVLFTASWDTLLFLACKQKQTLIPRSAA